MNRLWIVFLLGSCACGCAKIKAARLEHVSLAPTVKIVEPEVRDIHCAVAQPGAVEPYEQTAIFSKVAGFVQKWYVDIGAHVKKDQLLAELLVPELAEEHKQKVAMVEQEKALVTQAEKLVRVAQSNVDAASDAMAEAQANVARYEADVERWEGELKRLDRMVKDLVVNPEVLAETKNQAQASHAAYEAAGAAVKTKESQRRTAEAEVDKAKADLAAAEARVEVAKAEERRLVALLAYTKITAPYDGVVTTRNVNTGDFVRPAGGDSSGPETGGGERSTPLFVVARTDPVMFVIGVPEVDAPYVSIGNKASLRLQALAGREFNVQVSRTSLALRNESRTLQAEIDLPNPHDELLPGMYAYGSIEIERPKVWAIPVAATAEIGNRTCCYMVSAGKAVRTQIQAGVSDGKWVEVAKHRSYPNGGEPEAWEDFTGSEQIISGDLSEIADGNAVIAEPSK